MKLVCVLNGQAGHCGKPRVFCGLASVGLSRWGGQVSFSLLNLHLFSI